MRSVPVRVRVWGVEIRDVRGRIGRETRGTRKKGKRSIHLIVTMVGFAGHFGFGG